MKKHADSIDAAILDRIGTGPQDRVWTPVDFLDLGSRAAVDNTLSRNCKNGLINRAGRGLCHVPRNHPSLGSLGPSYWKDRDFAGAGTNLQTIDDRRHQGRWRASNTRRFHRPPRWKVILP